MICVVHSSIGKFHHHDIAKQLDRHGMLDTFFTGYPKWKLTQTGLPIGRVRTFPWVMTPYMVSGKLGNWPGWLDREWIWQVHETFDRHVASNLPEADAFIGLSCGGLRTGREAIRRGMRYLCDRGSAHILAQDALLREEFERWGDNYSGIDPRVIDKEVAEYETADAILVPSGFAEQTFLGQGVPAAKLRRLPYGVDVNRFGRAGPPSEHGYNVLFVGQLSFQKGLPDLLHAFSCLQHPRKRLILVGNMRPEMRRYFQRFTPAPEVELRGHIPQAELKTIMSGAHVMVLPSVQDGFGLVMAQAMACGCPVIASEHTGASDLFTDGLEGFIVPIRSPEIIAERLQTLAEDTQLRQRMSEAALLRVQLIGGWDDYGDRLADTLTKL